ncbi:FtsW/RodA/SpoVE family cell cycle protein [Chloroflexota bacterium]
MPDSRKPLILRTQPTPNNRIQGRLLNLAALFMLIYAVILTLSPAVRARSWEVDYHWMHWIGLLLWFALFNLAHSLSASRLPARDPYLLPIAALLTGWGLLTVWRLFPALGLRQSIWLIAAVGIFTAGLRLPSVLDFLRRYKYLWLTTILLLTALTLLLGTNPLGYGPRMWLGCCGIYIQPSEILKLLLIVYLAAYLADQNLSTPSTPLIPLLAPTLVITGLAFALLLIQQDLGTAFILLFLYTSILYVSLWRIQILIIALIAFILALGAGYILFDVVHIRVESWINPWMDPSGSTYQIVQSLIAIANGGITGRGPGLGNPGLVPIAHSDFVFSAVTEESGLIGALGLLLLLALLVNRGLNTALNASSAFRSYLAAGLTTLIVAQSILIIGGNLRLLPLTGITLPFVSYGGSSLVTTYLSLLFLLHISVPSETPRWRVPNTKPYLQLGAFLLCGLGIVMMATGWWTLYRSSDVLTRTDNPRRAINDRFVMRGAVLDRSNDPINATNGSAGDFIRQTFYPNLSNIVGYTNPTYGQTGLEASLDSYLRGLGGNPGLLVWWNHLLYGQPPPGLDVRLSLDLELQRIVDEKLGDHNGALVLLNAQSGEILAMASHPTFDANRLEEDWDDLIQDENSPLFNRAVGGLYMPGATIGPMILAEASGKGELPDIPQDRSVSLNGFTLDCASSPSEQTWSAVVGNGCPHPVANLGSELGSASLSQLFQALGLYTSPPLRLPASSSSPDERDLDPSQTALGAGLQVSPLQMALAGATLSAGGVRPTPVLVTAINTPQEGWVIQSANDESVRVLTPEATDLTAKSMAVEGSPFWQSVAISPPNTDNQKATGIWYLAGTLPEVKGTPLTLALLLEEENPKFAIAIGQSILRAALGAVSP